MRFIVCDRSWLTLVLLKITRLTNWIFQTVRSHFNNIFNWWKHDAYTSLCLSVRIRILGSKVSSEVTFFDYGKRTKIHKPLLAELRLTMSRNNCWFAIGSFSWRLRNGQREGPLIGSRKTRSKKRHRKNAPTLSLSFSLSRARRNKTISLFPYV